MALCLRSHLIIQGKLSVARSNPSTMFTNMIQLDWTVQGQQKDEISISWHSFYQLLKLTPSAHAQGWNAPAVPTFTFWKLLAQQMIENKLNDDNVQVNLLVRPKKQDSDVSLDKHALDTWLNFMGAWDKSTKNFRAIATKYCKTVCATVHLVCTDN
jgi:hypothetical protein